MIIKYKIMNNIKKISLKLSSMEIENKLSNKIILNFLVDLFKLLLPL
jgi:hypothetical protein